MATRQQAERAIKRLAKLSSHTLEVSRPCINIFRMESTCANDMKLGWFSECVILLKCSHRAVLHATLRLLGTLLKQSEVCKGLTTELSLHIVWALEGVMRQSEIVGKEVIHLVIWCLKVQCLPIEVVATEARDILLEFNRIYDEYQDHYDILRDIIYATKVIILAAPSQTIYNSNYTPLTSRSASTYASQSTHTGTTSTGTTSGSLTLPRSSMNELTVQTKHYTSRENHLHTDSYMPASSTPERIKCKCKCRDWVIYALSGLFNDDLLVRNASHNLFFTKDVPVDGDMYAHKHARRFATITATQHKTESEVNNICIQDQNDLLNEGDVCGELVNVQTDVQETERNESLRSLSVTVCGKRKNYTQNGGEKDSDESRGISMKYKRTRTKATKNVNASTRQSAHRKPFRLPRIVHNDLPKNTYTHTSTHKTEEVYCQNIDNAATPLKKRKTKSRGSAVRGKRSSVVDSGRIHVSPRHPMSTEVCAKQGHVTPAETSKLRRKQHFNTDMKSSVAVAAGSPAHPRSLTNTTPMKSIPVKEKVKASVVETSEESACSGVSVTDGKDMCVSDVLDCHIRSLCSTFKISHAHGNINKDVDEVLPSGNMSHTCNCMCTDMPSAAFNVMKNNIERLYDMHSSNGRSGEIDAVDTNKAEQSLLPSNVSSAEYNNFPAMGSGRNNVNRGGCGNVHVATDDVKVSASEEFIRNLLPVCDGLFRLASHAMPVCEVMCTTWIGLVDKDDAIDTHIICLLLKPVTVGLNAAASNPDTSNEVLRCLFDCAKFLVLWLHRQDEHLNSKVVKNLVLDLLLLSQSISGSDIAGCNDIEDFFILLGILFPHTHSQQALVYERMHASMVGSEKQMHKHVRPVKMNASSQCHIDVAARACAEIDRLVIERSDGVKALCALLSHMVSLWDADTNSREQRNRESDIQVCPYENANESVVKPRKNTYPRTKTQPAHVGREKRTRNDGILSDDGVHLRRFLNCLHSTSREYISALVDYHTAAVKLQGRTAIYTASSVPFTPSKMTAFDDILGTVDSEHETPCVNIAQNTNNPISTITIPQTSSKQTVPSIASILEPSFGEEKKFDEEAQSTTRSVAFDRNSLTSKTGEQTMVCSMTKVSSSLDADEKYKSVLDVEKTGISKALVVATENTEYSTTGTNKESNVMNVRDRDVKGAPLIADGGEGSLDYCRCTTVFNEMLNTSTLTNTESCLSSHTPADGRLPSHLDNLCTIEVTSVRANDNPGLVPKPTHTPVTDDKHLTKMVCNDSNMANENLVGHLKKKGSFIGAIIDKDGNTAQTNIQALKLSHTRTHSLALPYIDASAVPSTEKQIRVCGVISDVTASGANDISKDITGNEVATCRFDGQPLELYTHVSGDNKSVGVKSAHHATTAVAPISNSNALRLGEEHAEIVKVKNTAVAIREDNHDMHDSATSSVGILLPRTGEHILGQGAEFCETPHTSNTTTSASPAQQLLVPKEHLLDNKSIHGNPTGRETYGIATEAEMISYPMHSPTATHTRPSTHAEDGIPAVEDIYTPSIDADVTNNEVHDMSPTASTFDRKFETKSQQVSDGVSSSTSIGKTHRPKLSEHSYVTYSTKPQRQNIYTINSFLTDETTASAVTGSQIATRIETGLDVCIIGVSQDSSENVEKSCIKENMPMNRAPSVSPPNTPTKIISHVVVPSNSSVETHTNVSTSTHNRIAHTNTPILSRRTIVKIESKSEVEGKRGNSIVKKFEFKSKKALTHTQTSLYTPPPVVTDVAVTQVSPASVHTSTSIPLASIEYEMDTLVLRKSQCSPMKAKGKGVVAVGNLNMVDVPPCIPTHMRAHTLPSTPMISNITSVSPRCVLSRRLVSSMLMAGKEENGIESVSMGDTRTCAPAEVAMLASTFASTPAVTSIKSMNIVGTPSRVLRFDLSANVTHEFEMEGRNLKKLRASVSPNNKNRQPMTKEFVVRSIKPARRPGSPAAARSPQTYSTTKWFSGSYLSPQWLSHPIKQVLKDLGFLAISLKSAERFLLGRGITTLGDLVVSDSELCSRLWPALARPTLRAKMAEIYSQEPKSNSTPILDNIRGRRSAL
eukprot:CFRG3128T1